MNEMIEKITILYFLLINVIAIAFFSFYFRKNTQIADKISSQVEEMSNFNDLKKKEKPKDFLTNADKENFFQHLIRFFTLYLLISLTLYSMVLIVFNVTPIEKKVFRTPLFPWFFSAHIILFFIFLVFSGYYWEPNFFLPDYMKGIFFFFYHYQKFLENSFLYKASFISSIFIISGIIIFNFSLTADFEKSIFYNKNKKNINIKNKKNINIKEEENILYLSTKEEPFKINDFDFTPKDENNSEFFETKYIKIEDLDSNMETIIKNGYPAVKVPICKNYHLDYQADKYNVKKKEKEKEEENNKNNKMILTRIQPFFEEKKSYVSKISLRLNFKANN